MLCDLSIQLQTLPHAEGLPIPSYATPLSAGMDLMAAIHQPIVLRPLERKLIPTGLIMALEPGYEAQVRPRSGLAYRHGMTVLNSPGTIDSDYRGEIKILLINLGEQAFTVERGMRVAQMIIAPVRRADIQAAHPEEMLMNTVRKDGGFGSTGL